MDYNIYILAEGQSSRMGTDKGLVKIGSAEMIQIIIDRIKPLDKEIIIISSNPDYKKFGCTIISDNVKNNGPAQGIITALEHSPFEKNIIISCDMPLVSDLMLGRFDELMNDSEIVCYAAEFFFPFPGVYSKNILPLWKEQVISGQRKMQQLIPMFEYKTLPIEDADLFLNVNTQEDILLTKQKLDK